MRKLVGSLLVLFLLVPVALADLQPPQFWKRSGSAVTFITSTWELGSSSDRINKGWFDDIDTTLITIGGAVTGDLSLGASNFIYWATDPADAGAIRLNNAQLIGWEASPAGTDVTLTVDSKESLKVTAAASVGSETGGANVCDSTTTTDCIYFGYDAGTDKAFIQALNYGISTERLDINPTGGAIVLSTATDPADAGDVRLGNAKTFAWEASPAGTDVTLTVDANEVFVLSADATVPDEAYGVGWNGSLEVPTKNAVYDKMETVGGGMTWTEVTGTSQSAAVGSGYITNNASLVTVTIPTTCAVGDVVRVSGYGAGGWKIAQNASEIIHYLNTDTTTGATGYLQFTNRYDAVEIICVVANTEWAVISSVGTITVN